MMPGTEHQCFHLKSISAHALIHVAAAVYDYFIQPDITSVADRDYCEQTAMDTGHVLPRRLTEERLYTETGSGVYAGSFS
jgi:hypothetical protein